VVGLLVGGGGVVVGGGVLVGYTDGGRGGGFGTVERLALLVGGVVTVGVVAVGWLLVVSALAT